MDGLKGRGQVIVMGATNRQNPIPLTDEIWNRQTYENYALEFKELPRFDYGLHQA